MQEAPDYDEEEEEEGNDYVESYFDNGEAEGESDDGNGDCAD